MKITRTELAKIVKEETEAYLSEYDETPDEDPESWYGDASPENTGQGAEFELGLFITKLDKIQPGLGIELDGILKKLDVKNKETP